MKTALIIVAILFAFCLVPDMHAQGVGISEKHGTATTTGAKVGFLKKGSALNFSNDASAGTDTLWCVVSSDSTKTRFPLLKGEAIQFNVRTDTVWIKTSANTIPYRTWVTY